MLVVAAIGENKPSFKSKDADTVLSLETVVTLVVVDQGRREVFGSRIQSLVAFLRLTCLTQRSILLDLGPERLIGGSYLAWHVTGHLRRQMIDRAYFCIRLPLQGLLIAHLAMRVSIARGIVQGFTIGQLRGTQCLELLRTRRQFQLRGNHLFHSDIVLHFTENVK